LITVTDTASSYLAAPTAARYDSDIRFTSISAGERHTCAVAANGDGYCWGQNETGQLGADLRSEYELAPVLVAGGLNFRVIDAGADHTCGLTADGVAYCWGGGSTGELGTGASGVSSHLPVPVTGEMRFASITAGRGHTCALDSAGVAYCWGANHAGQLGTGGGGSATPTLVAGALTFADLSASSAFTCGVTTEGAAYCWGVNHTGNLGTGTTEHSPVPELVAGRSRFAHISAGESFACGVTDIGEAYCWGKNEIGQLGNGTRSRGLDPNHRPVRVDGERRFLDIAAGSLFACGLVEGGEAYCWGDNRERTRKLGNTASPDDCAHTPKYVAECSTRPVPVAGGLRFATIAIGADHTCALTAEGRAYCWGVNWAGGLGTGSEEYAVEPAEIRAPR
jgi:alpha-tubulin suppressor-like RCC1 family protein